MSDPNNLTNELRLGVIACLLTVDEMAMISMRLPSLGLVLVNALINTEHRWAGLGMCPLNADLPASDCVLCLLDIH